MAVPWGTVFTAIVGVGVGVLGESCAGSAPKAIICVGSTAGAVIPAGGAATRVAVLPCRVSVVVSDDYWRGAPGR